MARDIRIVEVGPRDGLQNEPVSVSVGARVRFVDDLVSAGVREIEVGSFVSPSAVPQMAGSDAVFRAIQRVPGVKYMALVPNVRGYERARQAGVDGIALFAAASEAFSQANLRASIDQSFSRFAPVASQAIADGISIRGYVSVAFSCPYAGPIDPLQIRAVSQRLFDLGCDEVSIADTIGVATPGDVDRVLDAVLPITTPDRLAMHFHDTHGRALANVNAAIALGVTTFDSAAGGMGGCPFAPGAPGNLGTERLVTHLRAHGYTTGINVEAVAAAVRRLQASLTSA